MKAGKRFFASPFWDTVPGFLLMYLVLLPCYMILLFPIWAVTVLYLSLRSLFRWENIGPYS